MTVPYLSVSRRLRETPFTPRVEEAKVKSYTVYNHMLLPTVFHTLEDDYHHLKSQVQIWDVSCQRQVEIQGPDANFLLRKLTPRDLSKTPLNRCTYLPITDPNGRMLNDSVLIQVQEDCYWLSTSDYDINLWISALAIGANLDVAVKEADVYPVAIQGPKSLSLMEKAFGSHIRDLDYFDIDKFDFANTNVLVSRTGYSGQLGYEIYAKGSQLALTIWDTLFECGAHLNVRVGCPNLIERIEAGLLSYGNDMTRKNTPIECGFGWMCTPATNFDYLGLSALHAEQQNGPCRMIRYLSIDGPTVPTCSQPWPVFIKDNQVGHVSSAAYSPTAGTNVAIGMIASNFWHDGTSVQVKMPHGPYEAEVFVCPQNKRNTRKANT